MLNIIGIWIAFALQIRHDHIQTKLAAETNIYNLARAFEEHVISEIKDIDKLLLNFRAEYRQGFMNFQNELQLVNQLGYEELDIPMVVIDRQGKEIYSDRQTPAKILDFSNREYFSAQLNSKFDTLLISRPEQNPLSGEWVIHFTRKLYVKDGRCGGILVASVPSSHFSDFFATVNIGTNGAITLFGTDRLIRARASGIKSVNEANGIAVLADHPAINPGNRSGTYSAKSVVDGVMRLSAYRKLENLPLVVQVGLSEDDIFAPSINRRNNILMLGIIISAAFAGALVLLLKFEQQQQLLTEKITRREAQLQTTLNELELLVTTDPLTELPNRRSFFSRAQTEFARTARYNHPLALIMLDLDHFKEVNDRYGHLVGDAALQHISAIMKGCIRDADMVARYGGEEFVILLPETEEEGAAVIAERVRADIETSPLLLDSPDKLFLTASLGLACLTGQAEFADIDKLLQAADDAMYRAKSRGRNCTCVAVPRA
jgi:diguanylate cyclase (GGDEF)-like protein